MATPTPMTDTKAPSHDGTAYADGRLRFALRVWTVFGLGFPAVLVLVWADPFEFFWFPLAMAFLGLTDSVMSSSLSSFFEV
jgi:hypothetical protein